MLTAPRTSTGASVGGSTRHHPEWSSSRRTAPGAPSASFNDLDGNNWLLQEITTRLPGRIEAEATSFSSASDLAAAMRRAAAAHGEHEKRIGGAEPNWPDWYAEYMVSEQAGSDLPK